MFRWNDDKEENKRLVPDFKVAMLEDNLKAPMFDSVNSQFKYYIYKHLSSTRRMKCTEHGKKERLSVSHSKLFLVVLQSP